MANTKITNPELFNLGGAVSTTYNITVQTVGVNNYFYSNGTQQPVISLVIGTQYIINQDDASNSSHPLILSTSSTSSGVYSTGVEYSLNGSVVTQVNYINGFAAATQRSLTITLQAGAPVLYYICYYHQGMGAAITNVNDGINTTATQLPVMTTTERIAMNPTPTFNVDYLVVAGGGGGGGSQSWSGGGGGGGGLKTNVGGTSLALATGGSGYTVTVGAGGAGGSTANGINGDVSVFNNITSTGGGGGGGANGTSTSAGSNGGSGGGALGGVNLAGTGITGEGNDGGTGGDGVNLYTTSGGGGGAGAVGGDADLPAVRNGGDGGDGLQNDITVVNAGTGPYYAGGGGGGTNQSGYNVGGQPGNGNNGIGGVYLGRTALQGTNATGGGGGGGGRTANSNPGKQGGSGIVILKYPTADVASYTAIGLTPTETTVGTDTVLSFTTVGTGTISFISSAPIPMSVGEMIFNSTTDKVEYFDGTKWYGITYGASPAQVTLSYVLNGTSSEATITASVTDNQNPTGPFTYVWSATQGGSASSSAGTDINSSSNYITGSSDGVYSVAVTNPGGLTKNVSITVSGIIQQVTIYGSVSDSVVPGGVDFYAMYVYSGTATVTGAPPPNNYNWSITAVPGSSVQVRYSVVPYGGGNGNVQTSSAGYVNLTALGASVAYGRITFSSFPAANASVGVIRYV